MFSLRLCRLAVLVLAVAAVHSSAPGPVRAADTPAKNADPKKNEDIERAEKAFGEQKFDDCLKALQDAEKKDPKLPPARSMLANFFLIAAGNQQDNDNRIKLYQNARINLERAIIETPNHPEPYLLNGNIAIKENRLTDCILNCQTALTLAGDSKWSAELRTGFEKSAHDGLANAYEKRGDWEQAKTHFMALLRLEPKSAPVMQKLAGCLFNTAKPDEAYAQLQAAKEQDANLDPAEVTMGLLWAGKKDAAKAEEWFQKAINRNPALARVHQAYGNWLLETGNLAAAGKSIQEAKRIDPNSPTTRLLLGIMARYDGKLDEAERTFEDLHRDQPADFGVSNQLAQVLVEQTGTKVQQERALQIALLNKDRLPRNPEAWATLGWVCLKTGREADAEKSLNSAISLGQGQLGPDTAYFIAVLLDKKDAKANADAIRNALDAAVKSPAFIHRADAVKLLERVNRTYPKKDEPKKDGTPAKKP